MANYYSRYSIRSTRSTRNLGCVGFLVILGLIILSAVGTGIYQHTTQREVTFTVRSRDDQITSSTGHQYLVFTNEGIFKDTDTVWFWKWDSSDVFNQLQPHQKFICKVVGKRITFTSSYPNIITCSRART